MSLKLRKSQNSDGRRVPNKFWEKPSFTEAVLLIASVYLIFSSLPEFNLFSPNSERGFFYDYQVMIGGLFAFGAGFFVWINGHHNRLETKIREKETSSKFRIYYAKICRDYVVKSDFLNALLAETCPSNDAFFAARKFNSKFLESDTHINFFNNSEVELIAALEEITDSVNIMIEQMAEYIKNQPEMPFNIVFNQKRDGYALRYLSKKAEQLAKIIDEEKFLAWRRN